MQLGHSAYHYSFNNPLSYSDPTGLLPNGGARGGFGHTPAWDDREWYGGVSPHDAASDTVDRKEEREARERKERQQKLEGGEISPYKIFDASINVAGGVFETLAGGACAPLIVDGVARVGFNSIRLFAYCVGANDFGDALPSNALGMIGKIGDMMSGTDFYEVGHGQAWASTANDLLLMITPFSTAGAMSSLITSQNMLAVAEVITAYWIIYSQYNNVNAIGGAFRHGK